MRMNSLTVDPVAARLTDGAFHRNPQAPGQRIAHGRMPLAKARAGCMVAVRRIQARSARIAQRKPGRIVRNATDFPTPAYPLEGSRCPLAAT
jgi:hypothetical protein